jgi:hypothetical protein
VADAEPTPEEEDERPRRGSRKRGEGDVTPDLHLKHSGATLATYIRRQMKHLKHTSETFTKTPKNV